MTAQAPDKIAEQIKSLQQQHILQFWDQLTDPQRSRFENQLKNVDWSLIESLSPQNHSDESTTNAGQLAIKPPAHVVRLPQTDQERQACQDATRLGIEALKSGQVAAILLAGGQGSRLGFEHPKGMFPIGPVSGKSLFEILAEQIVALSARYGHSIPYLIMTSDGTHDETVKFFEEHQYFGLDTSRVCFFQQGYAPSLDRESGRLMLAEKGYLNLNPDGHGGLLAALLKNGLFDKLRNWGIQYLFTHQIDNPLVHACDPQFLGLHRKFDAQVSTKVVAKTGPEEKVGVAVDLNGRTAIIEYSDLSTELANERDEQGGLKYWAGSTAIHIFNRDFLESVATSKSSLPWHRAIKKIPFINVDGEFVQPSKENGIKFERFLFDTMPLAKTALIVETSRDDEFAPLKNKDGDYSADYVRDRMMKVARKWLKSIEIAVPDDAKIEISPRYALSASDLVDKKNRLQQNDWKKDTYLTD